jgi:Fe-S cluster assembly protein SufD
MNEELLGLIESASAATPTWLAQKRQLALRLLAEMPAGDPALLADWQTDPDLTVDPVANVRTSGAVVRQPLLKPAPQYNGLLQENLMEKALGWQANQENAAHLALLNGGNFIYVPDGEQVTAPIILSGHRHHPNNHDLILVGANVTVTIIDDQTMATTKPAVHATELLLGEGARVNFCQINDFSARVSRQVVAAYQAQDSELRVTTASGRYPAQRLVFNDWLDGAGAKGQFSASYLLDEEQHVELCPSFKTEGNGATVQFEQSGFERAADLIAHLAVQAPREMVAMVSQHFQQ